MKYTIAAVTVLLTVVSAQSPSDIPRCAVPCIDDARTSNTNCAADDYPCICSNKATLTTAATSCILQACGADVATNQVLPAVNALCNAVESGSSSSSSGATASSTITSTSTDTVSSTSTGSQQVTSTPITSVTSTPYTSVVTSNGTATSNPGGSSTYNTPTTAPTAGAATVVGPFGMLALGFAVAL
ncbi:hypothetical protein GGR53DRAFT_480366 [Hypoxylon sp. FL1150]|nr:hypothetical protein GGR53DRAFT_480366 [Hypoxylon sp. FL1150]